MRKSTLITLSVALVIALFCQTANAQCYVWRPFSRICALFDGYACQQTCAPCAQVRACGPFGEYAPGCPDCSSCYQQSQAQPCEPCQTCEPCESCEPETTCSECESCDETYTGNDCQACADGTCPLKKAVKRTFEALALSRVNATRAMYGLRPLRLNRNLEAGAYRQSQYCASWQKLQHASGVAEILAMSSSFDGAIGQWLRSKPHCGIMLNPNYTEAGAAFYTDRWGRVWCAVQFR